MDTKAPPRPPSGRSSPLAAYLPAEVASLGASQKDIPRIARDPALMGLIEQAIPGIPTRHTLYRGDARDMRELEPESIHLVLTSPPYWTLKEYRKVEGQLGLIHEYERFLEGLDK